MDPRPIRNVKFYFPDSTPRDHHEEAKRQGLRHGTLNPDDPRTPRTTRRRGPDKTLATARSTPWNRQDLPDDKNDTDQGDIDAPRHRTKSFPESENDPVETQIRTLRPNPEPRNPKIIEP
jgi:hypothetical protein